MNKNRKNAIKITNIMLTFMLFVWGICFINVLNSCKNNFYYTDGIVINWEELEYTEKTKMYTESKEKYNAGDIVLVNNVYANIITKVIIEYPINDYWYNVIFISNSKMEENRMAKKEKIKLKHAVVIDRINEEVIMCVVGKNRRDIVRNLILCGIGNSYPYRDMKIVYDADMFTNGKLVAKLKTEEISWKEWEAPIDKIENVAELGEKAVEALKKEIADSDKNKQEIKKKIADSDKNKQEKVDKIV